MNDKNFPSPLPKFSNALSGRTILITGANQGIGKTLALSCAEQGAEVLLLGRRAEMLHQVYDEIVAAGYKEPMLIPFDLENEHIEDYQTIAEAIGTHFGQLDGLVLNAAVLGQKAPIATYNTESWQKVMQININSQFYLCRALLPLLDRSKNGRIIFSSSSVGRQGRAFWGAYAVSKFAIEGLMQTLADELEQASSIRVNSFNPGATRTSMRAAAYPGEEPSEVKSTDELMPYYLYLLSSHSQHLHGLALNFPANLD